MLVPLGPEKQSFYNPQITKVEVTIEGVPNQLYSQGMPAYQQWGEAKKFFATSPGSKRHSEVGMVAKDLALADVSLGEFLTMKYSLWLDLRMTDDDQLHGSGRRIGNASEGITIQITKQAEVAGALNVYLYVITDARLNIEDGRPSSVAPGHPLGLKEQKLPSDVGVRYLYQPGELEGGRHRATDAVWSLQVYQLGRSVTKPSEPVLYYSAEWAGSWLCPGRTACSASRHPAAAGWCSHSLSAAAPLFWLHSRQVSRTFLRQCPLLLSNLSTLNCCVSLG